MQTTNYHKEIVSKYPSGQWVNPTNNGSNDYDVFADLHEWGLAERKTQHHYKGKTMIGASHYFKLLNS